MRPTRRRLQRCRGSMLRQGAFRAHTVFWPHSPMKPFFLCLARGAVIEYSVEVSDSFRAPDGVSKFVQVVGDSFPGPLMSGQLGDTLLVTVSNRMAQSAYTMHWHGLSQHGLPWHDGVASLTECGIQPYQRFTYNVSLNRAGTNFWHSHTGMIRGQGAFGPLVVYAAGEPARLGYTEERIVLLNDWYVTRVNLRRAVSHHTAAVLVPGGTRTWPRWRRRSTSRERASNGSGTPTASSSTAPAGRAARYRMRRTPSASRTRNLLLWPRAPSLLSAGEYGVRTSLQVRRVRERGRAAPHRRAIGDHVPAATDQRGGGAHAAGRVRGPQPDDHRG